MLTDGCPLGIPGWDVVDPVSGLPETSSVATPVRVVAKMNETVWPIEVLLYVHLSSKDPSVCANAVRNIDALLITLFALAHSVGFTQEHDRIPP